MIDNTAIVAGLLFALLGGIFYTAQLPSRFWRGLYTYVPVILLCYFVPSLFTSFGIISGPASDTVYYFATRYLLPATLVLLCLSINLPAIRRLGPKALVLFLVGTAGVIIGGPVALLILSALAPELVGGQGPDAVWRGMTTVAGSWIGGSANQAAMKEVFDVSNALFSAMVAVDVIVANVWMAALLFMAGRSERIDAFNRADASAVHALRDTVQKETLALARVASTNDLMFIAALAFGFTGLSHLIADFLAPWFQTHFPGSAKFSLTSSFFWLIILATTFGVALSFTPMRRLEGAGASKLGSVMIYFLVAAIGTHMDIGAIVENPGLFLLGGIWMLCHAALMLLACRLLRAPIFFMAVGSQANIGGAASAPVVASAFHPALAPVGVLLAVLGYAVGTYAAWICGQILRVIAE